MGRWFCNVRSLNKDLESLDFSRSGQAPCRACQAKGLHLRQGSHTLSSLYDDAAVSTDGLQHFNKPPGLFVRISLRLQVEPSSRRV